MTEITQVIHLDGMRARLPSHTSVGQNLDALLSVAAQQYQGVEQVFLDLLTMRALDVAVGTQLDGIGDILDLERVSGQSDDNYRFALQAQVLSLARSGDAQTMIETYLNVTKAPAVTYIEVYPATFQISAIPTVDTNDPEVAAFITNAMVQAKPAGVRMTLLIEEGFNFSRASEVDGGNNGPSDIDGGFGSSDAGEPDGGKFSRVL